MRNKPFFYSTFALLLVFRCINFPSPACVYLILWWMWSSNWWNLFSLLHWQLLKDVRGKSLLFEFGSVPVSSYCFVFQDVSWEMQTVLQSNKHFKPEKMFDTWNVLAHELVTFQVFVPWRKFRFTCQALLNSHVFSQKLWYRSISHRSTQKVSPCFKSVIQNFVQLTTLVKTFKRVFDM